MPFNAVDPLNSPLNDHVCVSGNSDNTVVESGETALLRANGAALAERSKVRDFGRRVLRVRGGQPIHLAPTEMVSHPLPRWRRVLSEPLVHFVAIGALLFAVGRWHQRQSDLYRIEVTRAHVAQLERKFMLQYGSPPAPATLEGLIRDDIHDEMLFRQGLAEKLDQDDEIVRRRIVQKEQFLIQNLHPPAEPDDARLEAFYADHPDRYAAAPRATFSHIFFSTDRGGDAGAQARARVALTRLQPGLTRGPDQGDPFPDLYDFSGYEPEQVSRLFGHTPFTDAVFAAPVGRWSGPYRSAYGWHLLYVDARSAAVRPPLSAVRERVRTDYLDAAQDQANAAAFDALTRRFTVVRADRRRGG